MPDTHITEDLRSKRTEKALYDAMFSLLKSSSFAKVTVRGICEEALISRAAFYSHFIDKYDLLKHWLERVAFDQFKHIASYGQAGEVLDTIVQENMPILKNLLSNADDETLGILFQGILSSVDLTLDKNAGSEQYAEDVVFANFFAGGILSYLQWQVNNRFPSDVPTVNQYLFQMIRNFRDWRGK